MASLHSGADIACGVFILVGKEGPADKREGGKGQGVGEARRKYHTTIAHMIGLGRTDGFRTRWWWVMIPARNLTQ
jgi:hypothetical protein